MSSTGLWPPWDYADSLWRCNLHRIYYSADVTLRYNAKITLTDAKRNEISWQRGMSASYSPSFLRSTSLPQSLFLSLSVLHKLVLFTNTLWKLPRHHRNGSSTELLVEAKINSLDLTRCSIAALSVRLLGRVLKYGSPLLEFFHIIKLYSSRFIRKSWQESRRGKLKRSDVADDAPRRAGKIMRVILNFNCDFNYGIRTKETCFTYGTLISTYVGRMRMHVCIELLFPFIIFVPRTRNSTYLLLCHNCVSEREKCVVQNSVNIFFHRLVFCISR